MEKKGPQKVPKLIEAEKISSRSEGGILQFGYLLLGKESGKSGRKKEDVRV